MHNLSCVIIISTISLAPIDKDVYVRFATKLGEDNGKQVEKTAIEDLNDLVDGYTYCFQRSMKTVLSLLPAEEAAARAFIFARIDELLTSNTEAFQDSLSGLPPNQRALLFGRGGGGKGEYYHIDRIHSPPWTRCHEFRPVRSPFPAEATADDARPAKTVLSG